MGETFPTGLGNRCDAAKGAYINGRLNLTHRRSSRIDLARRNLEDRFFCLAEHGAKRSALAKPKRAGGFRFSTQEYQYRTVHCNEAVAVCLSFGAAGRIPCDFQCDFDKYALWRLSRGWNIALSAHETGRSAGLDLAVIRLCGTQQTIYFSTGNHDPSALSNRFGCAPV